MYEVKTCSSCNIEKELNNINFESRKNTKDGFRSQCRDCRNIIKREKYTENKSTNSNRWTEQEKDILMKYYPYIGAKEIRDKFLPNRTPEQIMDHAIKRLKLKKDSSFHSGWSQEQIDYLNNTYTSSNISIEEIAKNISKSTSTVTAMANSMGLYRDIVSIWSEEEKQVAIQQYPFMQTNELQVKFLKDKTVAQITKFANENGIFKTSEFKYEIRRKVGIDNLKFIPNQSGENSPLWKERFETRCSHCNSVIKKTESKLQKSEKSFCNYECMGNWMSENLLGENNPNFGNGQAWTDEMRRENAKRSVKRLIESDFKFYRTEPEKIIDDLLDKLNINYESEYDCKYYLIDNYLIDYNLMIEVQGNFFHCNPTMNLENGRKTKIIGKDKAKHTYVSKYYDIEILYLWEKDIKENVELCKELILNYINNNGKLNNYHSYNYYLLDGELKLFDDLYEFVY